MTNEGPDTKAGRTVSATVSDARQILLNSGVPADEAPGDAEVLARHVLGWDLTQFALQRRDPFPEPAAAEYGWLIGRRAAREPVSQIVGHREFWGLDFFVTRDVLTPRPETELIVQGVLNLHERDSTIHIADVGTGSGCLAIALAIEFPRARVAGTDLSAAALAVAARNVARHGVGDRVSLHEIDLLDGLGPFDVIVSNPPYVPLADAGSLMPEVIGFEPPLALFGGLDGLDLYRRLLSEGHRAIRSGGHLVLELGVAQVETVTSLAGGAGWQVQRVYRDLHDIDRTLVLS